MTDINLLENNLNLLQAIDDFSNVDYYYYPSNPKIKIVKPFNKKSLFPIPYIAIDGFTFSIRRFYKNGERIHIIIYSCDHRTGDLYRCEYYTSNSNLSFYRYCIRNDGMYIKGSNYVSSTFINIRLQKFINDYQILFDIPKQSEVSCQNESDITRSTLEKRINNDEYKSQNLFFKMMDMLVPHVDIFNTYKSCLLNLLNELRKALNTDDTDKISLISEFYCLLNKKQLIKDVRERRTDFFLQLKEVIEEFFLKNFRVRTESKRKLFDKVASLSTVPILMEIYKVNIVALDSTKVYYVYYIKYRLDGINYKNIIHIRPYDTTITKYGLDSKYVSAGAFVNKSFDYKIQSQISKVRDGAKGVIEDDTHYRFIGHFTNYSFLP